MCIITNHALKQYKKRYGGSKKTIEKNINTAIENGIERKETHGHLRRYLDAIYHRNSTKSVEIIFYNHFVFIFAKHKDNGELILITAYPANGWVKGRT